MSTFYQSTEAVEFLRCFGPYVGEGIDVWCPGRNRYGRLMGLPYCQAGDRPKADVLLYHTEQEVAEECLFDCVDDLHNVLPVLWSHCDLLTKLPNGKVAAEELAEIIFGDALDPCGETEATLTWSGQVSVARNNQHLFTIAQYWTIECPRGHVGFEAYDYLRHKHFAVGLAPGKYHRKTFANCEAGNARTRLFT